MADQTSIPKRLYLDHYIEMANRNSSTTFAGKDVLVRRLLEIDEMFHEVNEALAHPSKLSPVFFVPRAHAAYWAAVRIASGAQPPESYALMRLCLENVLYAYFVSKDPDRAMKWVEREKSPTHRKEMRRVFQITTIIKQLPNPLKFQMEELYDNTISFGAHPNPISHLTGIDHKRFKERSDVYTMYLQGGVTFVAALKNCARVGAIALDLIGLIFPERYKILSLDQRITKLKENL